MTNGPAGDVEPHVAPIRLERPWLDGVLDRRKPGVRQEDPQRLALRGDVCLLLKEPSTRVSSACAVFCVGKPRLRACLRSPLIPTSTMKSHVPLSACWTLPRRPDGLELLIRPPRPMPARRADCRHWLPRWAVTSTGLWRMNRRFLSARRHVGVEVIAVDADVLAELDDGDASFGSEAADEGGRWRRGSHWTSPLARVNPPTAAQLPVPPRPRRRWRPRSIRHQGPRVRRRRAQTWSLQTDGPAAVQA